MVFLIGDSDPNKLNNISVFDWNGKGLIRYKTDKQIFKLSCYPGNPSELYALTFFLQKAFPYICTGLRQIMASNNQLQNEQYCRRPGSFKNVSACSLKQLDV